MAKQKYNLEDLGSQMQPEHTIPELITGEIGAEKLEYNSEELINELKASVISSPKQLQ